MEFKLPELGENIASGDVVNVLVNIGEQIEVNQGVIELETDKAVVEIPCPHGGKVTRLHVKKGDTVKVGQAILTVEGGETPQAPAQVAVPQSTPAPAPPTEKGPAAAKGQSATAKPSAKPAPATAAASGPPASAQPSGVIPAGPAARRLARELGVDLTAVEGSGSRGRITPADVQAAAGGSAAGVAARPVSAPVTPPGDPGRDAWGAIRTERMSKIRKTIAAQMMRSLSVAAQLTNFDDADVTDLEAMRQSVPQGYLGQNLKLTALPFILRAVAIALRHHPTLNASIDDEHDQIVYKEYVHLGVAVDTPRGLVVPVVRDADRLGIAQLAAALATVAQRARAAQFGVEELRGGTFTISNMGAVGGTYSTPVINHPEVAILLVGRSRWQPAVYQGNIEKRFMMPLSLTYDHRLVDGAAAARFLNEVIELLESPVRLLL